MHYAIPTLMRSYMYVYGYRSLPAAKEALREIDVTSLACDTCGSCTVDCTLGFDIKGKMQDIARIAGVPDEFVL
jgi:hypothetical protein